MGIMVSKRLMILIWQLLSWSALSLLGCPVIDLVSINYIGYTYIFFVLESISPSLYLFLKK